MLVKAEDAGSGMKTIITFGTFDVFHIGHLRILQRAGQLGDRLIVGISSDALNMQKNCPWVKPRPESQKLPGKVGRLI